MDSPDVLVVGGGAIGCGIAHHLARRGVAVTVLERDTPGAHASWAAAGMLSPLAEADEPNEFLALLRASRLLFPAYARSILDETGIDVGYRDEGTLLLALTEEDEKALATRYAWQSAAGLEVERLSGAEARAAEPGISPEVRAALRFPGDHQVDSRELTRGLAMAARRAGADIRTGAEVVRLLADEAGVGVELAGGATLSARWVVVAAGCWAGRIPGLPRALPVEPVHGQLVAFDGTESPLRHVVDTPRVYLVPRRDGRIIAGATVERTGFRTAVTAAGLLSILQAAVEAVPALAHLPVLEHWSGLRPGTPDGFPIIGQDPDVPGLIYATGHFRNGILLTPITAEAVGALITGDPAPPEASPFGIERFA